MITGQILSNVASVPFQTSILGAQSVECLQQGLDTSNLFKVNDLWESYFNSLGQNVSSLRARAFDYTLRNPDFNILSANGTTPVTPAQGSDYELVSNWYLVTGGGSNDYTLTPEAYGNIPHGKTSPTGSNYFISWAVNDLGTDLYLYNLNYSTTSAFNSISKYSGKIVTFSTILYNNNANLPQTQFTASIEDYGDINSGGMFLQPGLNLIFTRLAIPDLEGETFDPSKNLQFRYNVLDIDGGMDVDFYYFKTELSNYATPLQLDHTLEQLLCDNLT